MRGQDRFSIEGKFPPPRETVEAVVIGAGPAGVSVALDLARSGARVVLIDENPVSPAMMGDDTPLFWGQRMTGAVQSPGRMLEQVFAATPGLEEAFDLGVDVRLGVTVWGGFMNGPGLASLPQPVLGLADAERAWTMGFERLIIAAGSRDLVLGFPGWDQPGVMGAQALHSLLVRYDAFAGHRLVIAGSDTLALSTARLALDRGLDVAAIVEVRDRLQGPDDQISALAARGVAFHTGTTIVRTHAGRSGVEAVSLTPVGAPGQPILIACDTLCLAIGTVPMIELFSGLGANLTFDAQRGGHVPRLDADGLTSLPGVSAAGDCAGVTQGGDTAYHTDWARALAGQGDGTVIVCQCEAVSRDDLTDVQPPAYLGPRSPAQARRDLKTLLADGPGNQDQIKRLTRAGMGVCQGRRCREQIALTLARESQTPLSDLPLAGYRAPVRPLPLSLLAAEDEAAPMSENWDVWFGIPSQWLPYAQIPANEKA